MTLKTPPGRPEGSCWEATGTHTRVRTPQPTHMYNVPSSWLRDLEPGPRVCTLPASGRVSRPRRFDRLIVTAAPRDHGTDLVPFLSWGLCAAGTNTGTSGKVAAPPPPANSFDGSWDSTCEGPYSPLSPSPMSGFRSHTLLGTPRRGAVLSLSHPPPPTVCAHVSLGQKYRTGVRSTASGLGPPVPHWLCDLGQVSIHPSVLLFSLGSRPEGFPWGRCACGCVCAMCTHMYMHRQYTHARLVRRCLFCTWTYKHAWPGRLR